MALYPFCVVGDVEKHNQNRDTYDTASNPTLSQVNNMMLDIYADMIGVIESAGYDTDNLHETDSTVALAITGSSTAQAVTLASVTGFSAGDVIKIQGLTSGLRAWEFTEISAVSATQITAIITGSYDAASVTIYVVNHALQILRSINAIGAAWKAEEADFMGTAPNQSDHAEMLKEIYIGSPETRSGLWAITNLTEYLKGATKLDTTIARRSPITSYNAVHSTDTDVEPEITKDIEW